MDVDDPIQADEHLSKLQRKFPGSQRVRKLEGMRCEARGDFADAGRIYEEMLAENPANSLARKRQVCSFVSCECFECTTKVSRFISRGNRHRLEVPSRWRRSTTTFDHDGWMLLRLLYFGAREETQPSSTPSNLEKIRHGGPVFLLYGGLRCRVTAKWVRS